MSMQKGNEALGNRDWKEGDDIRDARKTDKKKIHTYAARSIHRH
jgi:hypothetical protein